MSPYAGVAIGVFCATADTYDRALTCLERLMAEKWTWLVVPNNCVSFVEEVLAAGGADWASASNCPAVATAPTISSRIESFLNRLEAEIYGLYGVPRL